MPYFQVEVEKLKKEVEKWQEKCNYFKKCLADTELKLSEAYKEISALRMDREPEPKPKSKAAKETPQETPQAKPKERPQGKPKEKPKEKPEEKKEPTEDGKEVSLHTKKGPYGFLGPVVQSIVSLMSSLRVISLTILADSIYNILIFFAEKM